MNSIVQSAGPPLVLGIAGLPGSGKTSLIATELGHGRHILDDINNDWTGGIAIARDVLATRRPLVISDIIFCDAVWRQRITQELNQAVAWTYFANDPVQCVRNCTLRIRDADSSRSIAYEIRMIEILSKIYRPAGEVRPVYRPPAG